MWDMTSTRNQRVASLFSFSWSAIRKQTAAFSRRQEQTARTMATRGVISGTTGKEMVARGLGKVWQIYSVFIKESARLTFFSNCYGKQLGTSLCFHCQATVGQSDYLCPQGVHFLWYSAANKVRIYHTTSLHPKRKYLSMLSCHPFFGKSRTEFFTL